MESDNLYHLAQLGRVLNVMFTSSYIQLYHQPPNSVCSPLSIRCSAHKEEVDYKKLQTDTNTNQKHHLEVSTEPSSRSTVLALTEHLNSSLFQHQAKSVGLCSIRRAIYDQCFDELIRQVTVSCIEQGLLLFRIRNEFRMTLNYYRKAYEAGVTFGLNKAISAEVELEKSRVKINELEKSKENFDNRIRIESRICDLELKNKLESVEKLKEYYNKEINKRDQVIKQQRAIIRTLSQNFTAEIKSPILF